MQIISAIVSCTYVLRRTRSRPRRGFVRTCSVGVSRLHHLEFLFLEAKWNGGGRLSVHSYLPHSRSTPWLLLFFFSRNRLWDANVHL